MRAIWVLVIRVLIVLTMAEWQEKAVFEGTYSNEARRVKISM